MDASGAGQTAPTDNSVGDLSPAWSVDGQKIVFYGTIVGGFPGWGEVLILGRAPAQP